MQQIDLEDYLLKLPNVELDLSLGEGLRAYRVAVQGEVAARLFAIVYDKTKPLRVSLKADPQLALTLREKYESVMPSDNLDKKYWNTIIFTGQLTNDEVLDLAFHSYSQVTHE